VLDGGKPRPDCAMPCDMTAAEVQESGLVLVPAGCAGSMWRYDRAYWALEDRRAAMQVVADSMKRLLPRPCVRS
jgi:hypothetical protein